MKAALRSFPSKVFFLFLDTIVKVAFLKKCKEAGLLNNLFEEILDKLHLIQERLMDETTSESGTKIAKCLHTETSHWPTCKTKPKKYCTFSFCGLSLFFSLLI